MLSAQPTKGTETMPDFTTGDQSGPNYTSEELRTFKQNNGISDKPVEMVGEPAQDLGINTNTEELS